MAALWVPLFWLSGCSPLLVWYGHSANRLHRVEVVETLGRQSVRLNGHAGPAYDAIAIETVAVSADGQHIAYAAEIDKRWHVVLDGSAGPTHAGIGALLLRDDGRLIYAAEDEGRWRIYDQGRAGPAFAAIYEDTLSFTKTDHLVYVASDEDGVAVVRDSRPGKRYDGVAALTLADRHITYVARHGQRSRVVRDGREGPLYDGIGELVASEFRYAYAALREPHWFAVIDGAEQGPYDRVDGLRLSRQGRLAYVVRRGGKHLVVQDGVTSQPYAYVDPRSLRFAPDGRLSYVARKAERGYQMVLAGQHGPELSVVTPMVFSRSGGHWGYIGERNGQALVFIDGRPSIPYRWARDLIFSPNGERYAYFARRGPFEMVVHSTGRAALDKVVAGTLAFDDSSQHWACVAGVRSAQRFFLVVDGDPRKPFDIGEVVAASTRLSHQSRLRQAAEGALLRDWVAAELALLEPANDRPPRR